MEPKEIERIDKENFIMFFFIISLFTLIAFSKPILKVFISQKDAIELVGKDDINDNY